MGAHFADEPRTRPGRRRQVGILSIALGVGLLAFAFLDEDGTPVRSTSPTLPPSSEPTVLGVTVEPEPTTPGADPAIPVSLSLPDDEDERDDGVPTTPPRPTTTRPPSATTTTEGPVLIPPTVVTNTLPPRPTTTTTEPTTTTSTTAPASTSSSETTTTIADGGTTD